MPAVMSECKDRCVLMLLSLQETFSISENREESFLKLAWEFTRPFTLTPPAIGMISGGLTAFGAMGGMAFSWRVVLNIALGAVMAPTLRLSAGSPNERLALGYVGVANRAAANLAATANLKDLVEVAALCDVNANYLGVAHKRHPKARTYHDFRRMLEREKLDAVVVSTPDHCHAVATAAALRSGRHVYCEKPLTLTIDEGIRVRQVVEETGRVFQVGTQRLKN